MGWESFSEKLALSATHSCSVVPPLGWWSWKPLETVSFVEIINALEVLLG